jgi:hypothetical protein
MSVSHYTLFKVIDQRFEEFLKKCRSLCLVGVYIGMIKDNDTSISTVRALPALNLRWVSSTIPAMAGLLSLVNNFMDSPWPNSAWRNLSGQQIIVVWLCRA